MIVDQENNDTYVPLNNLSNTDTKQLSWESPEKSEFGQLEICNSILSEEAVMVCLVFACKQTNPKLLLNLGLRIWIERDNSKHTDHLGSPVWRFFQWSAKYYRHFDFKWRSQMATSEFPNHVTSPWI